MRILLADDSPAMRTMFRTVLEKLGHAGKDIVEAKEGREVLRALQNLLAPVDLVIFDWDLPGMDGLGLMSQLKQLGRTDHVSVLLSVNRRQRALLPQAARLGSCDAIDRPFTEEKCEAKLRSMGQVIQGKRGESSMRLGSVAPMPVPAVESDFGLPFLVRLPSAVTADLLKIADERRHEAGAVLLKSGQVSSAFHLVVRGQVELWSGGRVARVVGEGDPFGEFSYMMSEPATYTAQAKTVVLTASLSRRRISELLARYPVLDQHFSSLMARHKEAMSARATTIVQSDFKGTFDTMPFANVIQILNVGRKSGVLGIRQGELSGGIYLEQGEALHAWTEDATGEPAFYAMSGWGKAKFAFNSMRRETERTLSRPTLTLLLAAMRRLEEATPSPAVSPDARLDELFPSPGA
jgi:two-component system chemotaxis response regulator CheY